MDFRTVISFKSCVGRIQRPDNAKEYTAREEQNGHRHNGRLPEVSFSAAADNIRPLQGYRIDPAQKRSGNRQQEQEKTPNREWELQKVRAGAENGADQKQHYGAGPGTCQKPDQQRGDNLYEGKDKCTVCRFIGKGTVEIDINKAGHCQ